jgi:hypothetical protein
MTSTWYSGLHILQKNYYFTSATDMQSQLSTYREQSNQEGNLVVKEAFQMLVQSAWR